MAPAATHLATRLGLLLVLGSSLPAEATTQSRCRYNGEPRLCSVREAHRVGVSSGNHVDIVWPDGDRTSVRFLDAGRRQGPNGMAVLINGSTRGQVEQVQALGCGVRGCRGVQVTIRSSTGNVFSYTRFTPTSP
ncbi:MAG: hypothetical protein ACK5E6_11790 [Cyanobacteriota bacterium]|jgi:hypothetical protein